MSFEGKVTLITGAAAGIGKAVTLAFLRAGASCVAMDISETGLQKLVADAGDSASRLTTECADATSDEATARVVERTIEKHGGLDILVCAAGGSGMTDFYKTEAGLNQKWAEEIPLSEWEATIALNLTSPFLCAKYAIPHMKKRGWGRIINFSSIGAFTGHVDSSFAYAAYAAAKAGVTGFTRQLARELAKHGITANCVSPGATPSERIAARFEAAWREQGLETLVHSVPVGRMATVEEQAAAVLFLASSEASYITGHTLDVNGGRYMR